MPTAPPAQAVRCRLGKLLRERTMTLQDLHEQSGISRQTLSLYKRGNPARFDPLIVGKICETLKVDLCDFLYLKEVDADEI